MLHPWHVITCDQMRQIDGAASQRLGQSWPLMQAAGRAVAEDVLRFSAPHQPIHILCGPGNNGGDGLVAADYLYRHGYRVRIYADGGDDGVGQTPDAKHARGRWLGPIDDFSAYDPRAQDIVIDAIFGAGFRGGLPACVTALAQKTIEAGAQIWAIDMPSGVGGDDGQIDVGGFSAWRTITFGALKPGHVFYPGRAACGTIRVVDIGWSDEDSADIPCALRLNHPALWRGAFRPAAWYDHKYTRGLLMIYGGVMPGAAQLAACAGLEVGAGYVVLSAAAGQNKTNLPNSIVVRERMGDCWAGMLADPHLSAVVIGPGMGMSESSELALYAALQRHIPCVLDGDALNILAGDAVLRAMLGPHCVLTPHAGELRRLTHALGIDHLSRLEQISVLAARTGAVIVAKAADSVIATSGQGLVVDGQGHPALAVAGSGDRLAGMIGGLMAQGMVPWAAACCAVWHHGYDSKTRMPFNPL